MRLAIDQANLAAQQGEVPVGAILVIGEEVISSGFNQPISLNDPTAHAEIVAIRKASVILNNYRLPEAKIYITLEPCAMCIGAIFNARINEVIYGASELKTGAAGSVIDLFSNIKLNHHAKVTGGILRNECSEILKKFFSERRAIKNG